MSDQNMATENVTLNSKLIFYALACCLLTGLLYWPSLQNELTNWDDQEYLTENLKLQNRSTGDLGDYFFKKEEMYFKGNYHPLTLFN